MAFHRASSGVCCVSPGSWPSSLGWGYSSSALAAPCPRSESLSGHRGAGVSGLFVLYSWGGSGGGEVCALPCSVPPAQLL